MTTPSAIPMPLTAGGHEGGVMLPTLSAGSGEAEILQLLQTWFEERERRFAVMLGQLAFLSEQARELNEFLAGGPEPGNAAPADQAGSPNATPAPVPGVPCGSIKLNLPCVVGDWREVLSCRLQSAMTWLRKTSVR